MMLRKTENEVKFYVYMSVVFSGLVRYDLENNPWQQVWTTHIVNRETICDCVSG